LGWRTSHVTSWKHTDGGPEEEDVDGLHFYRTLRPAQGTSSTPVIYELSLMRALARRIDEVVSREKPDILHAHSPVLNALPALWVGRRRNLPVVYEIRAFWEDAAISHIDSKDTGGAVYRATRAAETFATKRADAVTTICEGLRSDLVARGLPSEKVTVIPNAVDDSIFVPRGPRDTVLAQKLGLTGAFVLGFLGSFYRYEGLHLLLDAMPLLLQRDPSIRVLLVGGGPEEQNLRNQAERLGLTDKVIFVGRVPHDQVQTYYGLVDLLVFPRVSIRLTELVTPLKPLEAMAQEHLVAASNVGGHRELIRDGENGFLFAPDSPQALADKVLEIADNRDRFEEIRRMGRNYVVEERNWARSVANYQSVYDRVMRR
jgi:PEP-CTERM/exosortase A-associated glycosyltransferase